MVKRAGRQVATALGAVAVVFRNPDMRRLQLAWAAASLSIWSFAIALGVYAFGVGGAAAVGVAGLVRILPGAVASPFAGLLGDRHPRRAVLLGSALVATAALAAATAAAALGASGGVVFALAGLFTVATTPYVPAEGALLPLVARTPQELAAANVAHSVMDNLGFVAGALVAGVLLSATSPEVVFGVAAAAGAVCAALLSRLGGDQRPVYAADTAGGVLAETARGARVLFADPKLRVVGVALILLAMFEAAADVLVVLIAFDLLGLGPGGAGYLNAAWGIGALLGAAALSLLLDRGRLAAGLLLGSLLAGISIVLPGLWLAALAGYLAWLGIGVGFTFVEVAARTLMQRIGSDETLARTLAALETARLAAMALGSIAVPALVALVGIEGTLIVVGALLPAFALLRWSALRRLEIGAPVEETRFRLLRQNEIFAPLPIETLERLSHDLVAVRAAAGEQIITEGDHGDRFYLIEAGTVDVLEHGVPCGSESEGQGFGEIALLRDVPRTATVRATRDCRLLALERDHFVAAVTGHRRCSEAAGSLVERRLAGER